MRRTTIGVVSMIAAGWLLASPWAWAGSGSMGTVLFACGLASLLVLPAYAARRAPQRIGDVAPGSYSTG